MVLDRVALTREVEVWISASYGIPKLPQNSVRKSFSKSGFPIVPVNCTGNKFENNVAYGL